MLLSGGQTKQWFPVKSALTGDVVLVYHRLEEKERRVPGRGHSCRLTLVRPSLNVALGLRVWWKEMDQGSEDLGQSHLLAVPDLGLRFLDHWESSLSDLIAGMMDA